MSINNNRKRKKTFCMLNIRSVSSALIIALTLLAGGFVLIGPMSKTSIAFAQEDNDANDTAGSIATDDTTMTNTSSTSPDGIDLSLQPVWQERQINTDKTYVNKTYTEITFNGNGTLTLPNTGETIIVNTNGTLLGSSETLSGYGRETVITEDGETATVTLYEIMQSNPETNQEKGIMIAVFDKNATGKLAPFSSMVLAGILDVPSNSVEAIVTLWEWKSGIENNNVKDSKNNGIFTPYPSSSPYQSEQIEGSTYLDNKSGVQFTIPSGWIGFENLFKSNVTHVMLMVDSPPTAKSFEESSPSILLQISTKDLTNNEGIVYPFEDIVNLNNSIYYQNMGCNQTSTKDVSTNNTRVKETVFTCPFQFNPSLTTFTKAIAIEKNPFQIMLTYSAYSDSQFTAKMMDFDKIIQSIKLEPGN